MLAGEAEIREPQARVALKKREKEDAGDTDLHDGSWSSNHEWQD